MNELEARERVIVALDASREESLEIARKLKAKARWVKVGMTLFYAEGGALVRELKEMGYQVFLDLKMHDIPHQVAGGVRSVLDLGVDMLTVHTLGGLEMMSRAQKAIDTWAQEHQAKPPISLGVTILTSMNQEALDRVGIDHTLEAQVERLAALSQQAGLSGVVASPLEAKALRKLLGPKAAIVCPGVRPEGADKGDQKRVTTPSQALSLGASHIVVGRPITQAADPAVVFENIIEEISRNGCL